MRGAPRKRNERLSLRFSEKKFRLGAGSATCTGSVTGEWETSTAFHGRGLPRAADNPNRELHLSSFQGSLDAIVAKGDPADADTGRVVDRVRDRG